MNNRMTAGHAVALNNKPLWKRMLTCWPLYLMLLPAIVYYIVICYVPIFGNVLAFKDYSFRKGIWGSPWVGLKYFRMFFMSYDCKRLILNTLHIGFIKCILEFPFAIILALLLNEIKALRYKKVTQTITYLPHFLSSVIIITMLQRILAPNTGILNQIVGRFGGDSSTFYLMKPNYFHRILFLMDIWRNRRDRRGRSGTLRSRQYGRLQPSRPDLARHAARYTIDDRPSVHHGRRRPAFLGI